MTEFASRHSCARRLLLALVLVSTAGCARAAHVEFVDGQCLIDGEAASLAQVEVRQARITERVLARQPWFVVVTILVVVLAGASHIEKIALLFSTRRQEAHSLGDRLRNALDRYRSQPVRYFAIVSGTLALLVMAGACYVYLDADKRASERALGLLQFCHLALKDREQQHLLDEQRKNLEALQSTAGSIRTLVDGLPPEEQRKAQEIVAQMNNALSHQGRLVSAYAERTDEQTKAVREHTAVLEKGLTALGTDVLALKTMPGALHDLSGQVQKLDGRLGTVDAKLTSSDTRLQSLESAVKSLAARPDPKCPACICEPHAPTPDGGIARPSASANPR
jgi:hypothetical protein